MSREFDPENPSNPYASDSQNPYAATTHSNSPRSGGLFDDLVHGLREREFSLEELISVSLRLYRRYVRELAGPAVIYGVVLGVISYFAFQHALDWMVFQILQDPEEEPDIERFLEILKPLLSTDLLVLNVATLGAQAMIALYTVIRTAERARNLDRAVAVGESAQNALQKLPLYLTATLISYFIILVGSLLCLAPGIYAAVHFTLLAAVIGVGGEGLGGLKSCFAVMRGRFWKTIGALLVCYLALNLAPFVISAYYSGLVPGMIAEQVAANPELSEADAARAILQTPAYYLATQLPAVIAGALFASFSSVLTAVMYLNYSRGDATPDEH